MSVFEVLVYMVAAIIFGYINDRMPHLDRRLVLAYGVAFWSLATALAGLSQNLWQLILFRSLVGVGEAAYGTIAPPFISDFFPPHERNIAFGVFYLAIPVGGALGFGIGSLVGAAASWRVAFFVCGLPGLMVAGYCLRLQDPPRGINDVARDPNKDQEDLLLHHSPKTAWRVHFNDLREIVFNSHWLVSVLGSAANNFALGGLADWYASFALRYQGSSQAEAGLVVGAITVVAGISGNVLGSMVYCVYSERV